jgi:hypothetical protein
MKLPIAISTVALMVAVFGSTPLGRAAYEAVVPANSVGTNQLKANAVTGAKIRNRSVQALDLGLRTIESGHVRDGSLLAADFGAGQLPRGPQGDKGDKGVKGDKGDRGDKGDKGEAATKLWALVGETGGVVRQNGVDSALRVAPGTYDVTFSTETNVGSCAWLASARETGFNASVQAPPQSTIPDRQVRVLTTNSVGAPQNSIFFLALFC